jgi:predicted DNA-binding ribbon-helix-helix protein
MIKKAENEAIEKLAQAVKDNEARVEQQRTAIQNQIYELENEINKPAGLSTSNLKSFDIADIESMTRETRGAIAIKIQAMKDALKQPACCDKQLLLAEKEYLTALRPIVEALESLQWEKINQMEQKRAAMEQEIGELNAEHVEADQKIESMLRVSRMSHLSREYEKRIPMNGLWGITTSSSVTGLIDTAIQGCEDGRKFNVFANFPHVVEPESSAAFGMKF